MQRLPYKVIIIKTLDLIGIPRGKKPRTIAQYVHRHKVAKAQSFTKEKRLTKLKDQPGCCLKYKGKNVSCRVPYRQLVRKNGWPTR